MAEKSLPSPDRRTLLRTTALGVAAAGVGVTAAACSSSNSVPEGSNGTTASTQATVTGPVTIATTSEVPVGGGSINQDVRVVVTQPTSGEFKAFTAVCTHAHCTVVSVTNNVIQCPCHGSQFSAKDGSVLTGPAAQPLAPEKITVKGADVIWES